MGCCDTGNDEGVPFPRNLEEDGEEVTREGCSDVAWLVIFLAYVAGMVAIVIWSMTSAGTDPRRLTHGSDWKGQICGVDVPEQYLYWCGSVAAGGWTGEFPDRILAQARVCLDSCPINNSIMVSCLLPEYHNVTSTYGGKKGTYQHIETMQMVVSQSVVNQSTYPTEPYGGKFCLPARRSGNHLRDQVITDTWAVFYRSGEAFGTLRRSWPLLLGVAVVTALLGYFYLFILSHFAGLLIFVVMVISAVVTAAFGLFFLFAIFVNTDAEKGAYQKANPLFHLYIGWQAQVASASWGVLLLLMCGGVLFVTRKVFYRIDEVIGVVQTAVECLEATFELLLLPLVQAAFFIGIVILVLFVGLPWVAALGHLDNTTMQFNGIGVKGLHHSYKQNAIDHVALVYYLFGCWWITEFFMSFGQFVVAYAVCLWYFEPTTEVKMGEGKSPVAKMVKEGIGRQVSVRIQGFDDHVGPRRAISYKVDDQKFLIVPVNKKGAVPGGMRLHDGTVNFEKPAASFPVIRGACVCFWHHMGSCAYGCLLIAICRPFRMFAGGFEGVLKDPAEEEGGEESKGDEEKPEEEKSLAMLICIYLAAGLEWFFGGYSKSAFTEIVLQACEFDGAVEKTAEFIMKSGGSVSYLYGCCFIYEVFGIFCLTCLCTVIFFACCQLPTFAEPTSDWYIPDPLMGCIFAAVISGFVAFGFMQIFCHTADTLLYAFAYNKKLGEFDPEEFYPGKYCPGALRYLLQPYELEAHRTPLKATGNFSAALMRAYMPIKARSPFRDLRAAVAPPSFAGSKSNSSQQGGMSGRSGSTRRKLSGRTDPRNASRGSQVTTFRENTPLIGNGPFYRENQYAAGPRIDGARPDRSQVPQMTPGSESQRELSLR
mmetsp:Transcript_10699/g.19868  ORF Transcript_10699/g.19868 Transcript_10699/m.19868 type:complete len:877 (-) Transcript_10699:57-2687(-)